MNEIKSLMQKNKGNAAKILIKDLVRLRHQIDTNYTLRSQIKSIAGIVNGAMANSSVLGALEKATSTLGIVSDSMNIQDVKKIVIQFSKESEKLNLKQEKVL